MKKQEILFRCEKFLYYARSENFTPSPPPHYSAYYIVTSLQEITWFFFYGLSISNHSPSLGKAWTSLVSACCILFWLLGLCLLFGCDNFCQQSLSTSYNIDNYVQSPLMITKNFREDPMPIVSITFDDNEKFSWRPHAHYSLNHFWRKRKFFVKSPCQLKVKWFFLTKNSW